MKPETPHRVPRLLPGTDLRGLPLSPTEAFIVSRVDGATSVAELSEQTGKSLAEVSELLARLASWGALALEERATPERRVSPAPAPRPPSSHRLGPIVETAAGNLHHPAASAFDSADLQEEVDIDLPLRQRILELYHHLDELTHYQLFGVDPTADRKAIKAAYFEVVHVFHPDRYFGKNVGTFKTKLEKVFARLTEGYNVLSRNQSRADYDAYLRARSNTRSLDAGANESDTHRAALRDIDTRIRAEAAAEVARISAAPAPPSDPLHQSLGGPVREPQPSLRPSATLRPAEPEERRRALARKLGRAAPAPSTSNSTPPDVDAERERQRTSDDDLRKTWAAEELKRRYQERLQRSRDGQVEVYTRAAKQALERGDNVGAANALRVAVSLSPEDQALAQQLNEVSDKARVELSSSYLAQAEYEERDEKWLLAAKSYVRVLAGRPEPKFYEKVAHCLLSGGGDLREAGEMARKAVMMQPDVAAYRVTLARFYVKAGLKQSAEGELSRGATLAPGDDKVTDWIRRLKRELG